MKKLLLAALAVMLLVAPAMAQTQWGYVDANINGLKGFVNHQFNEMYRDICENHRGTGDSMELQYCYGYQTDMYGYVVGRNPQSVANVGWRDPGYSGRIPSNYYGSSPYASSASYIAYDSPVNSTGGYPSNAYGQHNLATQNNVNVLGVANLLATGASTYFLAKKIGRTGEGPNPAKCIKDTMKALDKKHLPYNSDQVMAMCGMGSMPSTAPASTPSAPINQGRPVKTIWNRTGGCLIIDGMKIENDQSYESTSAVIDVSGSNSCPLRRITRNVTRQGIELRCSR